MDKLVPEQATNLPAWLGVNPNAALEVYLIPIFAISIILTILGVLVNRRLKRVDMLEALKSVE